MKGYTPRQQTTVYDVIKQRDAAREEARSVARERDQLRMLCQIAAHYLTYLPLRDPTADSEMIQRLEAASRGDMDVAAHRDQLPAPAGQAEAAAPSVQGDLQHPPAADPGEGRALPKDVTLTTTEKKLLRTLVAQPAAYDELCDALGAPRDRIITAMHHLRSLGLVTREGLSWRRT